MKIPFRIKLKFSQVSELEFGLFENIENTIKPSAPDYEDDYEDGNFTDDEVLQPGSEWNSGGNEDDFYPFGEDEESYASVDTWDTSSDGSAVTDAELIANGIHPHDYTHNKHCWVRESFD